MATPLLVLPDLRTKSKEAIQQALQQDLERIMVAKVVGGHGRKGDGEVNDGKSFLIAGAWLLKPFQQHNKVESELRFYNMVADGEDDVLRGFTPKFAGVACVNGGNYIKMENLLLDYAKPCCMDIKMGTRAYDDSATAEKKQKMIEKFPGREKTGFQVVGLKNWNVQTGEYEEWSGAYGKSLRPHTAITAFIHYFDNGERILFEVIPEFVAELERLLVWFESNELYEFIGSSVLLVFDADPAADSKVKIRMIDFAHVQLKPGQKDEGYMHGLRNLIEILTALGSLHRFATMGTQSDCALRGELRDVD